MSLSVHSHSYIYIHYTKVWGQYSMKKFHMLTKAAVKKNNIDSNIVKYYCNLRELFSLTNRKLKWTAFIWNKHII